MKRKNAELIRPDGRYLSSDAATYFPGEAQKMAHHWNSLLFFVEGEETPYYYMRSATEEGFRSGNIIRLGNGPLKPQESLPEYFVAMPQAVEAPYRKKNDEEYVQEYQNTRMIYTAEKMYWEDGPLKLEVSLFPQAFLFHKDSIYQMAMYHQDIYASGTFDGRKISGGGIYDRSFDIGMDEATDQQFHLDANLTAIDQNGKKIYCHLLIQKENRNGIGYYCHEGEEPLLFENVRMEADWQKLPYCPDTYSFTKARFYTDFFTIDYEGKWGCKGHTQKPRSEKIGFAHLYGDFSISGKTEKHQMLCSEIEMHNATKEYLRLAGFEIKE